MLFVIVGKARKWKKTFFKDSFTEWTFYLLWTVCSTYACLPGTKGILVTCHFNMNACESKSANDYLSGANLFHHIWIFQLSLDFCMLTSFVRGSFAVQLTLCLTALQCKNYTHIYLFGWIQTSQPGCQSYNDTSPYKVSECSVMQNKCFEALISIWIFNPLFCSESCLSSGKDILLSCSTFKTS